MTMHARLLLGATALALLPLAATAQDDDAAQDDSAAQQAEAPDAAESAAACGGLSGGQWIGGSEAASDVSTASAAMEQMALVLQGNEYVALFTASEPAEIRVEAQGRGGGDPYIDLYDESGEILVSDDDSGGGLDSRAEIAVEPGQYCLTMSSYDGAPMTGFVSVGLSEHEALTTGEDPASTDDGWDDPYYDDMPEIAEGSCEAPTRQLGDGPLDLTSAVSDTASAAEVPYWGFTLGEPTGVMITADNPNADPVVTLYDGNGGYLAENDDYDGLNSRIDMTAPLPAGDYCVEMTALSDRSEPITLSVAAYDSETAMREMVARGETSPTIGGDYPITELGVLGGRLRQDVQTNDETSWFSIEVPENSLVMIDAVAGGMGDPVLFLYDDFGRLVEQNDDGGDSLDSRIATEVTRGTYLVGVRQVGSGQQGLIRLLMQRFVPAE
ncbi:ABC transporter substrate-binding protein [Pseudoroseicyclus aestuarii]|uniref:Pre-peptidase n=1 Tax=Pseudoroseicyclus aestuarii TaxID=1795041 RepID=A0A318SS76_9RHOB|nr:ABC transporter substrate-binding protein [Pseudoroseicyclus aestuarii]PYE84225.1 pre-peptidase [Pseudoroseicyclus aestuarii]